MSDTNDQLEKSRLWKRCVALAKAIDEVTRGVFPHAEQYTFEDPLHRTAISLTSDIANVVGKGDKDSAFDYRYARGHLFTIKGLLVIAGDYDYLKNTDGLLMDIELIRRELDEKIEKLEAAEDEATK